MARALGRMKMWRLLPLGILVAVLGACQQPPDTKPQDLSLQMAASAPAANASPTIGAIKRAMLVPGGNYSMVTVRQRPDQTNAPNAAPPDILCTAPSPDWATAYSLAQQIAASGGVTGGASGSLSASSSTAETISMMAGRSAGVVALRDGLYNACQAYANGVIGKDAYALILSQYGNLLVALAGGSGGGSGSPSSSGTPSSGTPSGVAVAVSTGATPSGSASPSPASPGGASQAANSQVALMQQEMLQAMFVSCISENDPTVHISGYHNTLLNESVCAKLVGDIGGQAKTLMTPAASSGGGGNPPPKAAATPDPAITALQTTLKTIDPNLKVDGNWGPETQATLDKFNSTTPGGLKLSKP